MFLYPFKGREESKSENLNFLYKEGKVYVMDNHLAATWSWIQEIDLRTKYDLFHIDKHYDLSHCYLDETISDFKRNNISLKGIPIVEILDIKQLGKDGNNQFFKWDNYIAIFHKLYPEILKEKTFVTHKDGSLYEELGSIGEPTVFKLPFNLSEWISTAKTKTILNIDLDFFFHEECEKTIQLFADEYIIKVAQEVKGCWGKIEVLTLALSPECCGGWENSERVMKIFMDELGLNSSFLD